MISVCLGLIPSFHGGYAQVVTSGKKTPVITWANPVSISYGTALSDVQLNATANTPGKFTYNPDFGVILDAGDNQTLWADFTPDDTGTYYEVNGIKRRITVKKASPVVTWPTPQPIRDRRASCRERVYSSV